MISGFLITGIVVRDIEAGRFRFAEFWLRRIRRIAPNAAVMTLTIMAAGAFFLLPSDLIDLAKSCMFHQVGLSNMYFWRTSGYFDGQSELKPLLHTWSLSVEEQFYCILPLALVLLFRMQRRHVTTWLVFGLLFSLAFSIYCVQFHASVAFYWLPPRAWELLFGSLISHRVLPRQTWRLGGVHLPSGWICGASLVAILACSWGFSSTTPFPGVLAIPPCLAAGAFLLCDLTDSRAFRFLLHAPPLLLIGRASYSIYLWHWPILVFLRYRMGLELPPAHRIGAAIAAILTGVLFWSVVEEPIRRRKWVSKNSHLMAAFITAFVLLVGVGMYLSVDGWRSRFSSEFMTIVEVPYAGRSSGVTGSDRQGWTFPLLGTPNRNDIDFMLWGDSYAKCLAPLVHEKAKELELRGVDAGRGGTPPLLNTWTGTEKRHVVTHYFDGVLREIDRTRPGWLILVAGWDVHASGMSHLRDADGLVSVEAMRTGLSRVIDEAHRRGIKVILLTQPPYQKVRVPPIVARHRMSGGTGTVTGVAFAEHQSFQKRSRDLFREFAGQINILDIDPQCFDDRGKSLIAKDGLPLYSDAGHPSEAGVRKFYSISVSQLLRRIREEKTRTAAVSSNSNSE